MLKVENNLYKGLYISERDCATSDAKKMIDENALIEWRKVCGFSNNDLLNERLLTENLDINQFASILSNIDTIIPHEEPNWIKDFKDIIKNNAKVQLLEKDFEDNNSICKIFKPFFHPFLSWAKNRISFKLNSVTNKYNMNGQILKEDVIASILNNIHVTLASMSVKTLIQELHVAKLSNELRGDTSQDRFNYFVENTLTDISEILLEYPVLARLLTEKTNLIIDVHLETIERFFKDQNILTKLILKDSAQLKSLKSGLGDSHKQGRSVMVLTLTSGEKIVYKPRPLTIDSSFQSILKWANTKGFKHPFKLLQVINQGDYGWEEFVEHYECANENEINHFYYRQGGYIALLYLLQATDFHFENIIASGENPMLIDLESLFQNNMTVPENPSAITKAVDDLNNSIFLTAMLPIVYTSNSQLPEYSGLGGKGNQKLPQQSYVLDNIGTDEMCLVKKDVLFEEKANRPMLNGIYLNAEQYSENLTQGFEDLYKILMDNKEELQSNNGPLYQFKENPIRIIPRATQTYATFIDVGHHPRYLQDGIQRVRLFEYFWQISSYFPIYKKIIPSECKDLLIDDVPYFTSKVNSTSIWDSKGNEIKNFYEKNNFEKSLEKLNDLTNKDLEKQLKYMRMSLVTLTDQTWNANISNVEQSQEENRMPNYIATKEDFLNEAIKIGKHLQKCAFVGDNGLDATWIGIGADVEDKLTMAPLDVGLYDGVLGISLFMAYLANETGDDNFKQLAKSSLETAYKLLEKDNNSLGISAFYGHGSVSYVLAHLAKLWDDDLLLEKSLSHLAIMESMIEQDQIFDLMGGSAGTLIVCLQLYKLTNNQQALEIAVKCGHHLTSHYKEMPKGIGWIYNHSLTPLAGISHGNAGIAWALLDLAKITKNDVFYNTAIRGLEYEQTLYIPDEGNWKDLRSNALDKEYNTVNWCHGAAGIGLSRYMIYQLYKNETILKDIKIAVNTTINRGFGDNHSLCHGDLGNLELLLLASDLPEMNYLKDTAHRLGTQILKNVLTHGWLTGLPQKIETPGFMMGISGIGYGFLRLVNPEVPSILTLQL